MRIHLKKFAVTEINMIFYSSIRIMINILKISMKKYNYVYMSVIYCVKCKKKTATINEQMVQTKNDRNALTGNCSICNSKKYMFIKKQI